MLFLSDYFYLGLKIITMVISVIRLLLKIFSRGSANCYEVKNDTFLVVFSNIFNRWRLCTLSPFNAFGDCERGIEIGKFSTLRFKYFISLT